MRMDAFIQSTVSPPLAKEVRIPCKSSKERARLMTPPRRGSRRGQARGMHFVNAACAQRLCIYLCRGSCPLRLRGGLRHRGHRQYRLGDINNAFILVHGAFAQRLPRRRLVVAVLLHQPGLRLIDSSPLL